MKFSPSKLSPGEVFRTPNAAWHVIALQGKHLLHPQYPL